MILQESGNVSENTTSKRSNPVTWRSMPIWRTPSLCRVWACGVPLIRRKVTGYAFFILLGLPRPSGAALQRVHDMLNTGMNEHIYKHHNKTLQLKNSFNKPPEVYCRNRRVRDFPFGSGSVHGKTDLFQMIVPLVAEHDAGFQRRQTVIQPEVNQLPVAVMERERESGSALGAMERRQHFQA